MEGSAGEGLGHGKASTGKAEGHKRVISCV